MDLLSPRPIVTVDCQNPSCLHSLTAPFTKEELPLAQKIAKQLTDSLMPLMPAAGLAAPQIGISCSIFIFSYDRSADHLEAVINPTIHSYEGDQESAWEACLSVLLSNSQWAAAKIDRHTKIKVSYMNLEGEKVYRVMEGFAAKVFQHEYDHLLGCVNTYKKDAQIQKFDSKKALLEFMTQIKKSDQTQYLKPTIWDAPI